VGKLSVAVRIQDDHNGKVLDNLHDLVSIPSLKPFSAHLTLQYAFNQLFKKKITRYL